MCSSTAIYCFCSNRKRQRHRLFVYLLSTFSDFRWWKKWVEVLEFSALKLQGLTDRSCVNSGEEVSC